jgi:heme/copper-type cytochrome/quinol oxidase subunit 2
MKTRTVVLITLAAFVLAALPLFAAGAGKSVTTDPKVNTAIIKVDLAKTGLMPGDITVHKGQKITFELIAKDAEHGFKIDAYKVDKVVKPNVIEKVMIDATKVGTFPITSSLPADSMLKGELKVLAN